MELGIRYWRLEHRDPKNNSSKFYEVWLDEVSAAAVLAWGRIGTDGQHDVKLFPDGEEAKAKALAQVYAKQSKGYTIVHEDLIIQVDTRNYAGSFDAEFWRLRRDTQLAITKGDASPREAALNYIEGFITDCNAFLAASREGTIDSKRFEDLMVRWEELSDKFDGAESMMTMVKKRALKHV